MIRLRPGHLASPLVLGLALLCLFPALVTIGIAFFHYNAVQAPEFAGLANFQTLWKDPMVRTSLNATAWVVFVAVPLRVLLALGLALLLHPDRREAPAQRAIAFLPSVVPDVAWALLWLWLFNPLVGPTALVLEAFGVRPAEMLASPGAARWMIVITLLFLVGEMMLVLLAARRQIPDSLYEAGALEGASRLRLATSVTLPLLAPVIVCLACRDAILMMQATFTPALIVTEGGPLFATTFFPLYLYQNAFEYLRFGYAAALTTVLFAITAIGVAAQVWVLRPWLED
jgi:multiple sugar transport system permease protein